MRMRKKRHGSERLSSLSALLCADAAVLRENPSAQFLAPAPLCLEIGCGKGEFICTLSEREPSFNYFAMEKIDDVLVVAMEKYAARRGLGHLGVHGGWDAPDGRNYGGGDVWNIPMEMRGNVRFLSGDAKSLPELFPDNTFAAIHANFSDPWTKGGYEARRLTAPGFLAIYARLLAPVGTFYFKTDNVKLFEYSLETVAASPLSLTFMTDDLHAPSRAAQNIMTEYERSFTSRGVKIHALHARKDFA